MLVGGLYAVGVFQAFQGIWRVQEGLRGLDSALLVYSLYVMPQKWLPIQLIQGRIEKDIGNNLNAIKTYSEMKHVKRISLN